MTVLLIVGLGLVVVGCRAGSCDAEAWAFPAWWAGLGLTGLFGVLVFVLRIRREMALITTLAAAPGLAALAFVAAGGVHAWARWFGM